MEIIKDGTGKGYSAKVDIDNRLYVNSIAESIQHYISDEKEAAFQCIGTANLTNGTTVALHLYNNNDNSNMIVTYVRHQILDISGGTSLPNSSNYFRISLGRTYSSGGSEASIVNVNRGSSNESLVTAYQGNPTLSGTAVDIDRWYTKDAGDMNTFNKEGALIIKPRNTLELSYVGDQTSGFIYSRISFLIQ